METQTADRQRTTDKKKNTRRGHRRLPGRGTQVPGGGTYIPWRRTGDAEPENAANTLLYIGGNGKGLQQGNFSLIGALRVFQSV